MSDTTIAAIRIIREGDGSVMLRGSASSHVLKRECIYFDADEWAQVVAAASLRGLNSATIDEARALHAKPQP